MKFLLAEKKSMTQVFEEDGVARPVTVLKAGPCTVVQVKKESVDGYNAVQLGFGAVRPEKMNKPLAGHMKRSGGAFRYVREVRVSAEEVEKLAPGDTVDVAIFAEGDTVRVSGISKGKGFQGVVKRHGFAGGPRSHGQKHTERAPGSIGATGPQKVFKGKRMAGRMGGERVTVKNLSVVKVLPGAGELYVGGAIPGRRGTLIEISG